MDVNTAFILSLALIIFGIPIAYYIFRKASAIGPVVKIVSIEKTPEVKVSEETKDQNLDK